MTTTPREAAELTPAQNAELERRLATLEEDLKSGSTWEKIELELDHRFPNTARPA
jgi:putative addiction module component (TIGR02574 family)